MKGLSKHILRRKRFQPICFEIYQWGRYEKCQFSFSEGGLYGCRAGGVHPSWSVKESEKHPDMHLAEFKELFHRRNHKVNLCSYRFKGWLTEFVKSLVAIFRLLAEVLKTQKPGP